MVGWSLWAFPDTMCRLLCYRQEYVVQEVCNPPWLCPVILSQYFSSMSNIHVVRSESLIYYAKFNDQRYRKPTSFTTLSLDHQNPMLLLTWSTKNCILNQPFSPQLPSFVVSVVVFYYDLPPF